MVTSSIYRNRSESRTDGNLNFAISCFMTRVCQMMFESLQHRTGQHNVPRFQWPGQTSTAVLDFPYLTADVGRNLTGYFSTLNYPHH